MRNKSFEILAIAIVTGLLLSPNLVPVKAAPSSKNVTENSEKKLGDTKLLEDTPLFETKKFRIAFLTTLSMTSLAVLIGTGKSIKYNNYQKEVEADSDRKEASKDRDKEKNNFQQPKVEQVEGLVRAEDSLNTSPKWPLDDLTADYKQIYQNLQQQVYQSPHFANNPTWEIDGWEVDVEIAIMILSKYPDNFEQVKQVLLESDRVREWKKSLPQDKCETKTLEYIEKAYSWAQDLQKWRAEKARDPELSSR